MKSSIHLEREIERIFRAVREGKKILWIDPELGPMEKAAMRKEALRRYGNAEAK